MDRPAGLLSCSVDPRADDAQCASLCPYSEKADEDGNEAQHADDWSLLVQARKNGQGQGSLLVQALVHPVHPMNGPPMAIRELPHPTVRHACISQYVVNSDQSDLAK
jgi:hypothetical protein